MKKTLAVFLFFFSLYLLTAQGSIQTSDGMSMYLLTRSIAEEGTFSIESERIDIVSRGREGRYFSKYGVGQPLCAVPLYWAGMVGANRAGIPERFATLFTVSLFNSVVSSLVCVILFLCALEIGLTQRIALFLSCAYGISTTAWHYSQDFMSEPLTALLLIAAFYLVLRATSGSQKWYLFAGSAVGYALLVRPASLIVLPCFLMYIFLKERMRRGTVLKSTLYFSGAVTPFLCGVFFYNFYRFGSFAEMGYASHGFTTPLLVGLVGHLFTPGKSIFLYNPILIIAVIGWYDFVKVKPYEAFLVALVFLAHLLLYSKWDVWMGGMCWGSRFLLVTFPCLMLSSGFLLSKRGRMWWRIAVVLVGIGFLMQLPALTVNISRYHYTLRVAYGDQMMDRLIYSSYDSPLVGQWGEVTKVVKNLRNPDYLNALVDQAKGQKKFTGERDEEILANALALNAPNFWWCYLYLFGFPFWCAFGIPILLMSMALWLGFAMCKTVNSYKKG